MKKFILVYIILSFVGTQLSAQKLDSILSQYDGTHEFPRIGLALSGGAAHGLAHLGVIKYLEELNIPIDYVTGTSMGAIVGGLYAMGYSYDEMEEIISSRSWDDVIANKTQLWEVSPYEKQFHDKMPFKLRVEQSQLLLPKAVFEGHKLDLAIADLFSPANVLESYDLLPRPFKCYAVDLLSGNLVELDRGNLAQSVRASMAIPGIFTPIQKDSMLLVDGGLLKNFPVKENLEMGSDIVIGVYVGSKRSKMEDIKSMIDILRLTGFLTSINDTEEQSKHAHILIEPDVKDYPLLDFTIYQTFIDEGYRAAKSDSVAFKKLSDLFRFHSEQEVRPLKLPQRFFIEDVKITNPTTTYSRMLANNLNSVKQQQVSFSDISQAISTSFSTNNLYSIQYGLSDGLIGQILEVDYTIQKESSIGISANHFATTNSALVFQGTLRNVFTPLSNLTGYTRLSDNPAISGNYYQRLGKKKNHLFEATFKIHRNKHPFFINDRLSKEFKFNTFYSSVGVIKELDDSRMIRLRYALRNTNLTPQILNENDLADLDLNQQELSLRYFSNTTDKVSFPNRGVITNGNGSFIHAIRSEVSYNGFGAETIKVPNYKNNLRLQYIHKIYLKLSDDVTYDMIMSAGTHSEPSLIDLFLIGGTDNFDHEGLPFMGADIGDLRYQTYLYGRSGFRVSLMNKIYATIVGNILRGRTYNEVFLEGAQKPIWETKFGMGVSAGIESLVGPIVIDFGTIDSFKNLSVNVGVGFRFIRGY
ncbi:MAG: patatin-like phospholipase family protein [Saprospiraceae bacterium]|nr:patatin-like phospholipase family protein [Saprospiraceae bacterium]